MFKEIRCAVFLVIVALVGLSPFGVCQDHNRLTYRIANLNDNDIGQIESAYLVDELSDQIEGLLKPAYKNFWEDCCEPRPKPKFCSVVVVKMEHLPDLHKNRVFIEIRERWPEEQGGHLPRNWTCDSSLSSSDCYRSLFKKMAQAVKEYDLQCHSGKKCHVKNGNFEYD